MANKKSKRRLLSKEKPNSRLEQMESMRWWRQSRWREPIKTAAIALLTLSAILMLTQTISPLMGSAAGQAEPETEAAQNDAQTVNGLRQSMYAPVRIVVNAPSGRRCVQYKTETLETAFSVLRPLLGSALSKAGEPQPCSEETFQKTLQRKTGCYFEWNEPIPLAVLCRRFAKQEDTAKNENLYHDAKRVFIGESEEGTLRLYYINAEDGLFYACSLHGVSDEEVRQVRLREGEKGVFFAFETVEGEQMDPYLVFLAGETAALPVLQAESPLKEEDGLEQLFQLLGLSRPSMAQYKTPTMQVYRQENATLRLSADGQVQYTGTGLDRLRFPRQGEDFTKEEAIEAASLLAEQFAIRFGGALTQFYLAGVEPLEQGGFRVQFGCQVEGTPIFRADGAYAAEIQVEDGEITSFSLWARRYVSAGKQRGLLPLQQVLAAALTEGSRVELFRGYVDAGRGELITDWIVRPVS